MLTAQEIEVLEDLLEKDRLQKQLFQELCTQILDDEYGIPLGAYDTLCELADTFGLIIEGIDRTRVGDGRVYMTEEIPEEIPEDRGWFEFVVEYEYTDDSLWEWANAQDVATISDITYTPETKRVRIYFQFPEDQYTAENQNRMFIHFIHNAVAGK